VTWIRRLCFVRWRPYIVHWLVLRWELFFPRRPISFFPYFAVASHLGDSLPSLWNEKAVAVPEAQFCQSHRGFQRYKFAGSGGL